MSKTGTKLVNVRALGPIKGRTLDRARPNRNGSGSSGQRVASRANSAILEGGAMFRTAVAIGVLSTASNLAARAEPAAPPVIVVIGHGSASRPAEYANLKFAVRGEGPTAVEALKALAAKRTAVEQGLSALADVKSIEITNTSIKVEEARAPTCKDDADTGVQLSRGACAVVGYVTEIEMTAKILPAARAGSGASLASQLGATDVTLEDSGLLDSRDLDREAAKSAMEDARSKAEAIAAATSAHLGSVIKVLDTRSQEFSDLQRETAKNLPAPAVSLFATAQRRPAVEVDFRPPPVSREAEFAVSYSVLP